MINWKNMDKLEAYQTLEKLPCIDLAKEMSGESCAQRVRNYSVKMAEGLDFN